MWENFDFADKQDDECCDELFLDPIENGSVAEVKRINTLSFYEGLRKEGFPPGYQVLCKNCLAKKYGIDPLEFNFIQTFGELDTNSEEK